MYLFMRIFSLVLVVIALMLLGADMVTTLEHQGRVATRSVADIWALFDKNAVDAFRIWTSAKLPGFLAGVVFTVLNFWCWAIPGTIGFVLAFIFGRKHDGE